MKQKQSTTPASRQQAGHARMESTKHAARGIRGKGEFTPPQERRANGRKR